MGLVERLERGHGGLRIAICRDVARRSSPLGRGCRPGAVAPKSWATGEGLAAKMVQRSAPSSGPLALALPRRADHLLPTGEGSEQRFSRERSHLLNRSNEQCLRNVSHIIFELQGYLFGQPFLLGL